MPLAACGSSEDTSVSVNFENFEVRDEIFFSNIVIQDVEKPVWVAALQMDNMEIVGDIMQGNGDVFYYHFMTGAPSYALVNPIRNVQLATPKMREAAEVIFDEDDLKYCKVKSILRIPDCKDKDYYHKFPK